MTPFIMLGMTVGALLGLRWTVMALLPAAVVMLMSIALAGHLLDATPWWIGLTILLSIIGLQIGYLAAALARDALPYLRLKRDCPARPADFG